LTQKAIDKALEGDGVALRLCLDRIAPARKDAPVAFELPPIQTAGDTVTASSALLAAVAGGEVTPDEGGRVMALLTAHRALVETGDLEARIAALEAKK
jgi:tellurite resistance protein